MEIAETQDQEKSRHRHQSEEKKKKTKQLGNREQNYQPCNDRSSDTSPCFTLRSSRDDSNSMTIKTLVMSLAASPEPLCWPPVRNVHSNVVTFSTPSHRLIYPDILAEQDSRKQYQHQSTICFGGPSQCHAHNDLHNVLAMRPTVFPVTTFIRLVPARGPYTRPRDPSIDITLLPSDI
ncbi:hypothetical protein RRG08_004741 [Elysia crispata]|uniref:Uncharacterized protein n=1 Tax=Elysia crispata TaxID=231223 RepID=A0AAE1DZ77_9GAST|nr:hypothetical protein RRG08_004741 [Elysia crispata]